MDGSFMSWGQFEALGEQLSDQKQEGDRVAMVDRRGGSYVEHAGIVIRRLRHHVRVVFDDARRAGAEERWLLVDEVRPIAY